MAVVTVKSTFLTNRDATPKVLTDSFIANGQVSEQYGFATVTSGDSILSAYKMVSIPSNARLSSVKMVNAALGASCTVDIGVWYPTLIPLGGANFLASSLAGTLLNSTTIATAIAVTSAVTVFTEVVSTAAAAANVQEQPLWQMVGLATDPEINFDLGFIIRAAAAGATGLIAMKAQYVY
jgi:hypothetical protein